MAPPSPDAYNWTQFTDTMPDGVHDRMDRAVAFYFAGLGEEHREAVEDARPGGGEVDLLPFVTPDERKILEEIEDRTGRRPHLVVAEVGRGADGSGIAVEVIEALDTYGGAAGTLAAVAQTARWVYRKLSEAKGRRVMVSLGAAEHLAAADLVDRAATGDIALVGSGDMTSRNHDRAYTGGDAYFVVFQVADTLHHYHVTAFGELAYIGTSRAVPNHMEASPTPPDWLTG